jgi:RHS repeat-associated protein
MQTWAMVAKGTATGTPFVQRDAKRATCSALGHLVEETDGAGAILASFTDDTQGTLTSVVLGNPNSGPRYDYVYDGQGNVVALTDSSGNVVASYTYDAFGALTSSSETFPNGWSTPFRYDGAQGVRYDLETGLYWMSVRAYDPALGRFLSHDPLGRLAALGLDLQPYVYALNNPTNHTDPLGMYIADGNGNTAVRRSDGTILTSDGTVITPGKKGKPGTISAVPKPNKGFATDALITAGNQLLTVVGDLEKIWNSLDQAGNIVLLVGASLNLGGIAAGFLGAPWLTPWLEVGGTILDIVGANLKRAAGEVSNFINALNIINGKMGKAQGYSDGWYTGPDRLSHVSQLFNGPDGLFTYFYANSPSVSFLQKIDNMTKNPAIAAIIGDDAAAAEDLALLHDEHKVNDILYLAENCMWAALKSGESCD